MPFNPRTKDAIRDGILSNLQSRYQSMTGDSVDIRRGSRYWMLADAFALELSGIEAQAQTQTKQILPDKADTEYLARHGALQGVPREEATAAVLSVRVTGTPSVTITIGATASMVATNGLTFVTASSSVAMDGSGNGTLAFACQTRGAAGNVAAASILAWSAAPAGLNPTGLVLSITTPGVETETDAAWALRIIARMQEHPASFNRADAAAICEAYDGVEKAFVYPLLDPATDTVGTPGTVQVVCLGPIATDANGVQNGDASTNTRFIGTPGAQLTTVEAYIEGTADADGVTVPVASRRQKRPVTLPQGNYKVSTAGRSAQDITVDVVVTAANAKQWSGTMTVIGASTSALMVSGDQTAKNGMRMLVPLVDNGTAGGYRSGRYMVTPSGPGVVSGGNTTFPIAVPFPAATVGTAQVYPAPANYPAIRLALLAFMDRLTPGDASSPSQRWPSADESGPSTLYIGEIIAALCSVPGVINATVSLPAANYVPPVKSLADLEKLILTCN